MIQNIKPTTLGKTAPDMVVKVATIGAKMFRVEGNEVKVPRKRRSTDDTQYEWLGDLAAPKILYVFLPDPSKPETALEVEWNDELQLFEGPADPETGKRDQYTGDNVMEVGIPDARRVEASPEAMNKLHSAINRFNAKTGKRVITRMVEDKRDAKTGRTLLQVREVYRVQ